MVVALARMVAEGQSEWGRRRTVIEWGSGGGPVGHSMHGTVGGLADFSNMTAMAWLQQQSYNSLRDTTTESQQSYNRVTTEVQQQGNRRDTTVEIQQQRDTPAEMDTTSEMDKQQRRIQQQRRI